MAIRLINTETLRMKMFPSASAPRYAILSHTWVDGDEVDFQDMTRYGAISHENDVTPAERDCICGCRCRGAANPTVNAVKGRSGYQKIVQTCHLAKKHDIEWAWVDTCCIDKRSSAELSSSINSMYRWYSDAVVCYVFLSDLDPQPGDFKAALKRCRWFTRGWTLQELIAPPKLEFYNRDWTNVGSDKKLESLLREVTGINAVGFGRKRCLFLQQIPVATKMSWAAGRETTQAEDKAYCLLGIFDINMPLLYGEGDGAFRRLQEEILKRFDDSSIFCTDGSGIPSFNGVGRDVLAPSPASFSDSRDIKVLSAFMDQRYSRTSFSMTNRGLLVQNAYLIPYSGDRAEDSYYILELNCTGRLANHAHRAYGDGRWQRIGVYLQWIAPSLYIRLNKGWRLPARLPPSGRSGDGEAPGLTGDFYILTRDAYSSAGQRDVDVYALRNPCVELDSFFSTMRLYIARATPPQVWDVAARRFVGTGLGCAMLELADAGDGGGYFPLATFHIAFAMYPGGAFWVRLYPPYEWKDKEADFNRLVGGGDHSKLPDAPFFRDLKNGGATYCLLLGTDLKPHHGNGPAPVRARARVAVRWVTEPGYEQGRKHITVSIEVECIQGDGRYSDNLRSLRA
ncbi:hypothetical protein RB595_004959 [Gaeumannomyces hyphopodioides]